MADILSQKEIDDLMGIEPCEWKRDEEGVYYTSCKNQFVFMDEGIKENEFKYCPYCGYRIEEINNDTIT